ncbi:lipoprotein-releasing system ATP-binding protein LolD [Candidatus Roizmanbacteria bacterium CG_4_10_14_3_um_filter_39_13]|uniref:Lipoprotein-releasing system ATP-binding protein LolD n=2 Tax=Candidatus Roizmaniibacteriota TaxID=1752723 RepID=A0A2H0KKM8_9BACT|nr:MAG: lipoprotein-releasing system ATP-binding protein LolD [Candidatus Roizmanbacteria bacterium CG11_big_fil_rev_8_21_14_0_20_37_16]PIX68557.1 MAG: lipoprotein-releasing system ATP-binding protein LolD [Candidatus Roizmanbacteria bacterium CG_4_10_14_3_um_filter_39_13]
MIKLQHVNKSYMLDDEIIFSALKNIDLEIKQGEFTSIIGPSGSGKSTLMHIIGLLDQPTSGSIFIEGKDVSKLNDDELSSLRNMFVGFVFQQFNLINKLTVLENILIPTIYTRSVLPYDPVEKARYLLKRFGLETKEKSFPNKISGGQQQRVAIARALIMNPQLILADEPTGNLDTKSGAEILKLLHELHDNEKITVVIVTHDPNIAGHTKRKIEIRDGEIQ